jgi:hypothetical protein
MIKINIRFNRQHNNSGLDWKVFYNNTMYLARHINIGVPSVTTITKEGPQQEPHWNITCYGYPVWYEETLIIQSSSLL